MNFENPEEIVKEEPSYENQQAIITEQDDCITIEKDGYHYRAYDIKKGQIYRKHKSFDSIDSLPDAVEFIKVWDNPQPRDTFNFQITNDNETGVIILSAGPGILFKNDVVAIPAGKTIKLMSCVFNVQPKLIGVVVDDRDEPIQQEEIKKEKPELLEDIKEEEKSE